MVNRASLAGVPGDRGAGSVAARAGRAPGVVPMGDAVPRAGARRRHDADLRDRSRAAVVGGPPGLPLGGLLLPQMIARADLRVGSAFERVPSSEARSEHAPGSNPLHDEHVQLTVQERDRHLEPHADRMHRPGALEQHRPTMRQPLTPEETLHALAVRLGNIGHPPSARADEDRSPHRARPYLALSTVPAYRSELGRSDGDLGTGFAPTTPRGPGGSRSGSGWLRRKRNTPVAVSTTASSA